jgi:hypothetical protein
VGKSETAGYRLRFGPDRVIIAAGVTNTGSGGEIRLTARVEELPPELEAILDKLFSDGRAATAPEVYSVLNYVQKLLLAKRLAEELL